MRTMYSPPTAACVTVITQTCKLSDLRTTPTAAPTVSVGQESGLSCILCSGSHKAVVKVSPVSMLSWLWASVLCCWLEAAPGSLPGGPLTMAACFTEASKRESLGERWELQPWRTIGEVISCPRASCVLLATSQSWVPAPLQRKERHKGVDTKTQRTQGLPQSLWTQRGRIILQKPKAGLDPALKSGSLSSPERPVWARCPVATDNPGFSWGSPGAPPSWRIAVTRPQEPSPQGF